MRVPARAAIRRNPACGPLCVATTECGALQEAVRLRLDAMGGLCEVSDLRI